MHTILLSGLEYELYVGRGRRSNISYFIGIYDVFSDYFGRGGALLRLKSRWCMFSSFADAVASTLNFFKDLTEHAAAVTTEIAGGKWLKEGCF